MTQTSDNADKGRLPIFDTIALASSLVDRAPAKLIGLVVAKTAFPALSRRFVDLLAIPAAVPLSAKEAEFVVNQIATAILTGAIVAVAYAAAERQRCGIGAAFQASAKRFVPMLLVGAAVDIFTVLDFPFAHLVSLVIGIIFVVATPVCMIERLGPFASLTRSIALTRDNRGQIFGLFLVGVGVGGVGLAVAALLYFGLRDIADPSWLHATLIVVALLLGIPGILLALALIVIGALVPTAIYLNLRAIEDARDTGASVDAFTVVTPF